MNKKTVFPSCSPSVVLTVCLCIMMPYAFAYTELPPPPKPVPTPELPPPPKPIPTPELPPPPKLGWSKEEMEARILELEDKLHEIETNSHKVKAPFEVVDDKGNLLMKISNEAIGTRLLMSSPETQNTVAIVAGKMDSRVALTSVSNSSVIKASEKGSGIEIHNADIHAVLGSGDDGRDGLIINSPGVMPTTPATDGSGQMVAEISTQTGKKLALRLFDDKGTLVVSAGSNPSAAGAGTVKVANTKGESVAFIGTSENGESGALGVAKNGKNTAALLSEPRMIVLYNNAGEAITTLAKSQEGTGEGGNITLRQPDGEGVFSAGYNAELGGGDACVYRAKKQNVFCLGIAVPGMGTGH